MEHLAHVLGKVTLTVVTGEPRRLRNFPNKSSVALRVKGKAALHPATQEHRLLTSHGTAIFSASSSSAKGESMEGQPKDFRAQS